jgi:hypothetical protein
MPTDRIDTQAACVSVEEDLDVDLIDLANVLGGEHGEGLADGVDAP